MVLPPKDFGISSGVGKSKEIKKFSDLETLARAGNFQDIESLSCMLQGERMKRAIQGIFTM